MSNLKLGRKPALFTSQSMKLAFRIEQSLNIIGPAPMVSADFTSAVTDLVGTNWGMMLNDQLGCCTCSDSGHTLMLRTANTGTWHYPSDADIMTMYRACSGYDPSVPASDQGCDENVVCQYMMDTGLAGHKSVGTAPIVTGRMDSAALERIRWGVQLFGAVRLGVNLPDNAEQQFDAGVPWTVVGTPEIDGGHDVPVVKYDGAYFYVVTWGKLQKVSRDWLLQYVEEAHVEMYPDFLMSTGLTPAKFDMNTLIADMRELSA